MNKKQKILSCIGFVNPKSTAKMCNTQQAYVSVVWAEAGYFWREEKGYDSFGNKR
jgi:hypothetical protein